MHSAEVSAAFRGSNNMIRVSSSVSDVSRFCGSLLGFFCLSFSLWQSPVASACTFSAWRPNGGRKISLPMYSLSIAVEQNTPKCSGLKEQSFFCSQSYGWANWGILWSHMVSFGFNQAFVVRWCQLEAGWPQMVSFTRQGPQLGWLEQLGCVGFSLHGLSLHEVFQTQEGSSLAYS